MYACVAFNIVVLHPYVQYQADDVESWDISHRCTLNDVHSGSVNMEHLVRLQTNTHQMEPPTTLFTLCPIHLPGVATLGLFTFEIYTNIY